MANRNFNQFQFSLEKMPVDIFCTITGTGGTSAPTLNSWSGSALGTATSAGYKGVKSVAYNAAGDYTFTMQDNFNRLLDVSATVLSIDGSTTPLATQFWVKAVSPTAAGGATIRLLFYLNTSATGVQLGTNDRVNLRFTWSNSNAQ